MSMEELLAIWRRAQSVLIRKAPAMLKELKKTRREWDERDKELAEIWTRK